MAAPSNTVPPAEVVDVLTYVQEIVAGAAALLQDVPVVGDVCATFLSFKQLVETAKGNKEDLSVLVELCDVVIKGVLERRSGGSAGLQGGFTKLQKHVDKAETVTKLCNGVGIKANVRKFVLARKVCKEIAAVRNNVRDFCTTINLVINHDLQAKLDTMVETLAERENMLAAKEKELEAKAKSAIDNQPEEQRKASIRVKVPPGAPRLRDWYVTRHALVARACNRLGIGSSGESSEEPRMVGLAGSGGTGKSTVASMVVARDDVRTYFNKGVLWISVGQGAKYRLSDLMFDLAHTVWETVLRKTGRSPRKANVLINSEDGAAYIREVVDESSRRFLVVADDVWDVEVLRELKRAGVWVLYTTRDCKSPPVETPPLRVDHVQKEEAEMVLRRAAELDDDERLPEAAYELMERCDYVILNLAMVGRWGGVRGRSDDRPWRAALDRIVEAQEGGSQKGGQPLPWRAAVLRAGLGVLASDNPQLKELYLALAILPTGLAFPSRVAGVLLYGHDCSRKDQAAAKRVLETLERLSILTREKSGSYHVHEDHVDFVWACLNTNQDDTRGKVLPRWRSYISSVQALNHYSSAWLVKIWDVFARVEGKGVVQSPYSAVLEGAVIGSVRPHALKRAAEFHFCREDWLEAYTMYSKLRLIEEEDAAAEDNNNNSNNSNSNSRLAVAKILHNLGMCAYRVGRQEETEGLLRRALAIQRGELGADNRHVANTLHSLGEYIREAGGRTQEAEGVLRQALCIMKETAMMEDDPLSFARILHSMGVCVYKAERPEEAEGEFLRQALAIREDRLGHDHTEVANTLYYLGGCAHQGGRAEQADELLQRVLGIYQQRLGSDHPDVADTLYLLGVSAFEAGRTEEAEVFYQRALVIREEKLGTDHHRVAETRTAIEGCAEPTWTNPAIPAAALVLVVAAWLVGAALLWQNGPKGRS